MHALLDLSTEVLIDILSFLPATNLFSVRRTCRTICDIVNGTARLQYILRTHAMGVEDLLPPDFPYSNRFKLLRRHEQSLNALRFNFFTKGSMSHPGSVNQYILQGGYLIYDYHMAHRMPEYLYTDVYAATRDEELRWVHIRVDNGCPLSASRTWLTFAVDHNLVVVMRFISL